MRQSTFSNSQTRETGFFGREPHQQQAAVSFIRSAECSCGQPSEMSEAAFDPGLRSAAERCDSRNPQPPVSAPAGPFWKSCRPQQGAGKVLLFRIQAESVQRRATSSWPRRPELAAHERLHCSSEFESRVGRLTELRPSSELIGDSSMHSSRDHNTRPGAHSYECCRQQTRRKREPDAAWPQQVFNFAL